jgi:2-aminoadipate transaminase
MTAATDQSHTATTDSLPTAAQDEPGAAPAEAMAGRRDWTAWTARRTQTLGGGEITAILALAGASDVITFSGGFPDPATFPTTVLSDIAARVITDDPGVALQYSATEGLAGVRDYVSGRLALLEGRAPGAGELMITSGGIDCMELVAKSYLDTGDVVVVEAPTYLGAIMAFRGYEADVRGVPVDGDGMQVDKLAESLAAGLRPKILYTIPDFQNPTGLTMSEPRRHELVALARRYGFLILEDVAYSELGFEHAPPPSLWSVAPDVVLQAGTFSKIFCPGVRMGWAAGPEEIISRLVVAKQNSDQCSGALGQRMLEEYGRGGHMERQLVESRALYARRARLMAQALTAHMPAGTTWTSPHGGFYIWLTAPAGVDTVALSAAARARKVAYVPGRPFYPGDDGTTQIRLAYSRVADDLIDEGVRRIGEVLRTALGKR